MAVPSKHNQSPLSTACGLPDDAVSQLALPCCQKAPSHVPLILCFQLCQGSLTSCCRCRLCMLHSDSAPSDACLDSAQLKVTHVNTFWRAVERTAAAGRLMPGELHLDEQGSLSVSALSNSVIILPRSVSRLHPVHHLAADHIYTNLAAWDIDFLIEMLRKFLLVSSAKTVPSLAEYRVLPDKVRLSWIGLTVLPVAYPRLLRTLCGCCERF